MMIEATRILPSILSADFARLGEAVSSLEREGCDLFHVDVMDGRFVPNLTFGPKIVRDVAAASHARFDCHLMVVEPERVAPWFDIPSIEFLTVHAEATVHLHRLVGQIREMGKRPGVALNPATPLEAVRHVLPEIDLLLIMSVNPGFGGQRYIPQMTEKIRQAADLCAGRDVILEVDGGLDESTLPAVAAAGARYLVAGNAIYGAPEPVRAWEHLRACCGQDPARARKPGA